MNLDLDLEYEFEPMYDGRYQVRLSGIFVCFSNHTDERGIDEALKERGFYTRREFLCYSLD